MNAAKVILVSWHPPESDAIAARRIESFTRYLPDSDWDVVLITRTPGPVSAGVVRHCVSDPIADLRARLGRAPRMWQRLLSAVLFRIFLLDEQLLWSLRVRRLVKKSHADVILITGPPFSQWLVALWLGRRTRVVLDYRDLWTGGPYFRKAGLSALVARVVERTAWDSATAVTTVSAPLAADLRGMARLPAFVVLNGIDEAEVAPDESARSGGPLVLTYAGQLYQNKRDPTVLFNAVKRSGLSEDQIKLQFYVPDPEVIDRVAGEAGIRSLVHSSSMIPRSDLRGVHRESDVLILLLWNDEREEGVLTGKIFEYMAARRPILMQGWPRGVAARLIHERGLGVVANSVEELVPVLREWARLKGMGKLDEQLPLAALNGLTRREQARSLARALAEVRDRNP